jgi:hypothetical protein
VLSLVVYLILSSRNIFVKNSYHLQNHSGSGSVGVSLGWGIFTFSFDPKTRVKIIKTGGGYGSGYTKMETYPVSFFGTRTFADQLHSEVHINAYHNGPHGESYYGAGDFAVTTYQYSAGTQINRIIYRGNQGVAGN